MRQLLPEPADEVDLEQAYAVPDAATPYVRVNFVSSLDAAVTLEGASAALSSPHDRTVFHLLRGQADVILAGAATVRDERYGPARPDEERQRLRASRGQSPVPPIAIVTTRLAVDLDSAFFTAATARPLVFTTELAPERVRAAAAERADIVVAGESMVDTGLMVDELAARGLRHVLCEGGPRLFTELLAADRVDELCLTLAPVIAGGGHHRLTVDHPIEPQRFTIGRLLEADDGYLFARYLRR
ncbi:MAG: pyrimidine reductase family protein [Frankiaceae bacterium]